MSNTSSHSRKRPKNDDFNEEKLKLLFEKLDVNRDGHLCDHDVKNALSKSDTPRLTVASNLQKWLTNDSEEGKYKKMAYDEFANFMMKHEEQLWIAFSTLDENGDGRLDAREIMSASSKFGIVIEYEEAHNLIKRMSPTGSDTICYDEWRDYLLFHPCHKLDDILQHWRHATFVDIGEDSLVPDDFTEKEMKSGMWWRHLVAGGVAGAVSRTCTAPLDRIKVFLQVRSHEFPTQSSCVKHMLEEGGTRSLWRGNAINIFKIAPETALKFAAYEQTKRLIRGDSKRELSIYERFVAGSIAGSFSQTVVYPLEVLKTRMALRKTGQCRGVFDMAYKIYKKEGIWCFYRGYVPNFLGIIPYAGIDLAIYETLKNTYINRHQPGGEDPGVLVLLACGTISSTCGQLASYPLALVRTRLQASIGTNKDTSLFQMFKSIIEKDGFPGLYRGITPNFLKVAPAVSISYVVYEHVRQALGVTMT